MTAMSEENYGEQEKDANSLLMELDKGLRSAKVGEQCGAIVRFPRLFEKYPFPILINSAFLKLADVFRVGNNFMRLNILQVTQQSEKHLEKILSVDEFIRRIYMVIHSNDPLARGITLRTLGSVACIIAERKNVHHSIINGLDSHDTVEQEAAIFAANHFAAQSKSFATSICSKLAEMIEGLETPVDIKLKLIPIFQHMHYDPNTATKVRRLCTSLLPNYPSRAFVLITLRTLSQLAGRTLIDIADQVELLLQYLKSDQRKSVKVLALQDLKMLACKGPHMWKTPYIEDLCHYANSESYEGLVIGALDVLNVLSGSIAVGNFNIQQGTQTFELCDQYSYHSNLSITAKSTALLTDLAIHANKIESPQAGFLTDEATLALESLILVATTDKIPQNMRALKACLSAVTKLSNACPALVDRFVDLMISALGGVSEEYATALCESLAAICNQNNNFLQNLLPDIVQALRQASQSSSCDREKLMGALVTLLLQGTVDDSLSDTYADMLLGMLESVNEWTKYKIGRQMARYGHHKVAAQIFGNLITKVSSEHFYFWLNALKDASLAESFLHQRMQTIPQFLSNVSDAETNYHKSIAALKAATTPNHPLEFQCTYLNLRAQSLHALTQLVKACNSFQTSPPPAIATSLAMTTGQEVHKCGHVVAQLHKSGRQFEALNKSYGDLYQSAFDADEPSLKNIQINQQCCQVMMYVLDSILNNSQRGGPSTAAPTAFQFEENENTVGIENQPLILACEDIVRLVQDTLAEPHESPLSHEHIECIEKAAVTLAQVRLCLPRFFFQSLQTTGIKLAISPQPRSANEPITVHFDTHLTLKVEGVIQHGSQRELNRKVDQIQLQVSSIQQSRAQMVSDIKPQDNPNNDMCLSTLPHNDYFSAQFLLAFPIAGVHLVTVNTSVKDKNGSVWKTGPTATLAVKSYDEAVQRKQQQQYAAQRQQQRAANALNQF